MAAVWTPSLPGVRASRATPVLKKRHVVLLFAAVGVVSFVVLLSKQHSLARQQRRVEVIAPYAQLRWSLSGVTPVAPDLALSPEAILVPRSGETRRFEFVKTEPVVDNPPRAECAQHDVVACEVRNQNGVLSVRAIANDRCFFQEAEVRCIGCMTVRLLALYLHSNPLAFGQHAAKSPLSFCIFLKQHFSLRSHLRGASLIHGRGIGDK